jgi:hypothetical protein
MNPDSDSNDSIERILEQEGVLNSTSADATQPDPTSDPKSASQSDDDIEAEGPQPAIDLSPSDRPLADTITVPSECKHCRTSTQRVCPTCHGPFCEQCASILDPIYCKICLNEPGAQLTFSPLKDSDGETHQGRDIRVSGPSFGTLCKRISDMSSYELEAHIDYYKDLVRQAEKSLDFRRVVLGASQIELAQRKDGERRRLRGIKVPHVKTVLTNAAGEIVPQNGPAAPRAKRDPVKDLAATLNVKPEDMSKLLSLLFSSSKGKKQ